MSPLPSPGLTRALMGLGLTLGLSGCFSGADFAECSSDDQCRSGMCVNARCSALDGAPDMGAGRPDFGGAASDAEVSDTVTLQGVLTPREGIEDYGDRTVIIDGLQISGSAIPLRLKAKTFIVRSLNADGAGYLGGGGGGGGAAGSPGSFSLNGGSGGSRSGAVRGTTGQANNGARGGDGGFGGDGNGVGAGEGGESGAAATADSGIQPAGPGSDAVYNGGGDACALIAEGVRYVLGASGGGGGGGAGADADQASCTVGGGGGGGGTGGNGGGAIELIATGEIVIEGQITARGLAALAAPPSGTPGSGACVASGDDCDTPCDGGDGGDGVDPQVSGPGTEGGAGGSGLGATNPGGDGAPGGAGAGGTVVLVSDTGVRFSPGASIDLSGGNADAGRGSLRIFGDLLGARPVGSGFNLCEY